MKIATHGILKVQIPNSDLDFWNSYPRAHFWANMGRKSQSCPFFLKIVTHGISTMLIITPILFSEFPTLNPFWANLGLKSQSCPFFLKTGIHGISRLLILIPTLVFWILKPKSIFGQNLGRKSQSCPFWLKIATQSISKLLILSNTTFPNL